MHDHLRNQLGLSTEVPPIRSGLESFRIVNEAIKKVRDQIDYCLVVTENYTQKEATLQVVLLQPEKADVLLSAFREAKWIDGSPQIGRASCRERVKSSGADAPLKKK